MKTALLPAALLVALAGCTESVPTRPARPDFELAGTDSRPNFILVLTDDQDLRSIRYMPKVQSLLVQQGVTFTHMFVAQSLCCPSRASILTGMYPHNHRVMSNEGPEGGFIRFRDEGHELNTVAVWLQHAGYRTILIGKYLNDYPAVESLTYVPPGWTEWRANELQTYYSWTTHNGATRSATSGFRPDSEMAWAVEAVHRDDHRPFFLYLSTVVPHEPNYPAPRHRGRYASLPVTLPPSFGEADRSDKPNAVRRRPLYNDSADAVRRHRERLESLLSVDDMVAHVWAALSPAQRHNTYVIFTSDNGYHIGEHGLSPGKATGYEEDIRVPLIVRGPGVPHGVTRSALVMNVDLAPTIAELAGIPVPASVDGRSLVPWLREVGERSAWRRVVLIDNHFRAPALRTERFFYAEIIGGILEFYDLKHDPYQLDNASSALPPPLRERLSAQLAALATCHGQGCRDAELLWSHYPAWQRVLPPVTR